jgi:hypothetical protein
MRDESGRQRKIIIFSEHRDTPNYLHSKVAGVLGRLLAAGEPLGGSE